MERHEQKSKLSRPLRIFQWNAEGMNTKTDELRQFLEKYKIDIALIQESKLTAKCNTPQIKGYTASRTDRVNTEFPGGGLMSYFKNDIVIKPLGSCNRGAIEIQSTAVRQEAKKWWTINKIYIPEGETDLSWIPVKERTIFAGDFNAYNALWDEHQPDDKRGDLVIDWMLGKSLVCLNDGSPTRINRATGGLSSPDITFTSQDIPNIKWNTIVEDDLGSDHSPIVIEIAQEPFSTIDNRNHRQRWKRKNVDRDAFRLATETDLSNGPLKGNFTARVDQFTKTLVAAGRKHIGKSKPGRQKFAINPKVRRLVKIRNQLRKQVATKRAEWLEAALQVRQAREEAKIEAWSEFVESLEDPGQSTKAWRVIKTLDGVPDTSAPNQAITKDTPKGKVTISTNKKMQIYSLSTMRV